MRRTSVPRRLAVAAAGLALAVVGAVAPGAPASAQDLPSVPPPGYRVAFMNVCDGTQVLLGSEKPDRVEWQVRVDGERVWPVAGDTLPGAGENAVILVGPGEVEVTATFVTYTWSHRWDRPAFCDSLPEPTASQPTCDAPASITVPALPDVAQIVDELTGSAPAVQPAVAGDRPGFSLAWRLDGADVAPESTHEVEPGTHVVSLHLSTPLPLGPGGENLTVQVRSWAFEIEAPDCADGTDDGADDGTDDGAGGELPKTGAPVALVAGAAVFLIALGGGLFLLARRRRTTFSA